ncbi:MAG TPA: hypothetical protein PKD48_01760 [Sphingopyxis sp.]|nr:hypothetical protein [Sphingopyxis sp.]
MPLRADLELAAITLPLDVVLEVITAAKGKLSEETEALLKIEVAHILYSVPRIEKEVMDAIFKETFG